MIEKGADAVKGDEFLQEKLEKSGKVSFITGADIKEIKGASFMEEVVYLDKKSGEEKYLMSKGCLWMSAGCQRPGFLKDFVKLNDYKEIIIDPKTNETSVKGVFASGDVTDVKYKQCVIMPAKGQSRLCRRMIIWKTRNNIVCDALRSAARVEQIFSRKLCEPSKWCYFVFCASYLFLLKKAGMTSQRVIVFCLLKRLAFIFLYFFSKIFEVFVFIFV